MTFLTFLLSTLISATSIAVTEEPAVSIATKIANQGSYVTGYDKEFKLIDTGSSRTWTAKNFNNNNSAWDNIRCGSKSAATTATITTDFAIAQCIERVDVEMSRYKTGSTNRMTSMALLVSPNADMSDATAYPADISGLPASTGNAVIISIPVTAPAENMYYQLSVEMPKVSSEGVFSVNSLSYFAVPLQKQEGECSAMLDFTDSSSISDAYTGSGTPTASSEYPESGANNLDGATFTLGNVSLSLSKADGTIQPRWWTSNTITPELRLNPDNVMTITTVAPGCRLLQVKFLQGDANTTYYNNLAATVNTNLGASALVDKTWTAPEDGDVDRLTMVFSDYCRCGAIHITYIDENSGSAAMETITFDDDAPVEFYNLQGTKVSQPTTTGIYIMRRGTHTSKIRLQTGPTLGVSR